MPPTKTPAETEPAELPPYGVAFYLSSLGWHSHAVWAERLAPLGLNSHQANMLLQVAGAEGQNQLALAKALNILPSGIVSLVDQLESRRLIRRRSDPRDRRVRTLHLTPQGKDMLRRLHKVVDAHEAGLCVGLDEAEHAQLLQLLRKAALGLGLVDTVHAGLAKNDWRRQ
jgi:MarR family transcriptional regulator, transcriptional regulator for hemolysin